MILLNAVEQMGCVSQNYSVTFGEWIKGRRKEKRWAMAKAAIALGISQDALHRIEKGETKSPQPATMERIVEVFGDIPPDSEPSNQVIEVPHPAPELDNNVTPAPVNALPIPEWSAEIACGHWVESLTASLDPDTQMAIIAQGRFIVRCAGDSMLPLYRSGDRVLFRIVRMDEEGLRVGADYYWQTSDGHCTLKTLKTIGEDEYVLAPRNRKYKPLRVAKQMVSRVAIVETIMRVPWEE